jgi:hypothetical protein
MKLFTVEEANRLLPAVRPQLEAVRAHHETIRAFGDSVKRAAEIGAGNGGGGTRGGSVYVNALYEIGRITTQLNDAGIQLKDYARGLIDFPSLRAGRVVLLCWQLGEAERIEWWHDVDAGFAGRQPL